MPSIIEKIEVAEERTREFMAAERRCREEALADDGEIDAEEQGALDRIKSKIDDLEATVRRLREEFEENKRIWESRAGELADYQGKLSDLHTWTFIPHDLFDGTMSEIERAAAAQDYATANAELTQGTTNIAPAHEQYMLQSQARDQFQPNWDATQTRLQDATVSEYQALQEVQSQIASLQERIEKAVAEGDFVTALEELPELQSNLDEYETNHTEIEEARATFESSLASAQPQINEFSQSRPEWEFMSENVSRLASLLTQMETQQTEQDYVSALSTLEEVTALIEEMQVLIAAKESYDQALQEADAQMAQISDNGSFKDILPQYETILSTHADALSAASAGNWEAAAGLMEQVGPMCSDYRALLSEQETMLSQIETNLPPAKAQADGLSGATSAKKARADQLLASVASALSNREGLAKAVTDLEEAGMLLEEIEVIFDVRSQLEAADEEDRDDIANAIVNGADFDITDVPTEARNMLVEALMSGDEVDESEHDAIAAVWSEEDFVDREFDNFEAGIREQIVDAIANDPDVVRMAREWDGYTDEEKREAYERLAAIPAEAWGIETPPVSVFDEDWQDNGDGTRSILLGEYSPGADTMRMNVSEDAEDHSDFAARMGTLVHEIGHKYQEHIEQQYRDGTLTPDSPIYEQARSHFLDDEYQSAYPAEFRELYETSPDEAHSRNMGHEMEEAMQRAMAEAEARAAAEAGDATGT